MLRHTLCQKPPVGSPLFFLQVLLHPVQDLAESADAVGGLSLSAQIVVLAVEHAQLALHAMELECREHFQTVGQRAAVILICVNAVEITGKEGDKVKGNLIELNYDAHVDRMQKLTVPVEKVAVTFEDDATFYLPFRSYRREAIPLEEKHGEIVSVNYLPENAKELDMILRRERFTLGFHAKSGSIEDHIRKLAVQHGVTEKLGVLPLGAQTAYNAVKEAHPEAIVCFAQDGYFEIYGEDAKKAAPMLGIKLLMKELEGGGQVAVTGFREDQWVAKAKDLWGQGNDVFVTQPGESGRQETVKHLKAEDYIPVGMVMDMDGKTVRVDSVDFPNEEVRLTDITDKQHPVQFWEKPSIVREYVENAPAENLWKAIDRREHGSRKKPSVLAKLKEHAKSAPDKAAKQPEHTKKSKGMER